MKILFQSLLIFAVGVGLGYYIFRVAPNILSTGECKSPVETYEDPLRIPLRTFLLQELGDLKGKSVLDVGAGTGFFSFEMARTAEKVYATEMDPLFLSYMTTKKENLTLENFEILSAQADHSELQKLKVDEIVLVYVFHYLDHPSRFLGIAKNSLNLNGNINIVNAQYKPQIIKDYLEIAGFENISQTNFTYAQEGCGPIEVQLIKANLAGPIALQ